MEPENQTPASPVNAEQKKGGVGALIGSIIIILILVLGALYFWGGKLENKQNGEINFDESSAAANGAMQNASDEVSDIDADFNKQETLNLDEDLNAVNQAQ